MSANIFQYAIYAAVLAIQKPERSRFDRSPY